MEIKKVSEKARKNSPKILLGALFIMTFILGWIFGHQDARFGQVGFTPNIINKGQEKQSVDFSVFWHVWDLIEKKYDGNVDYQKMVYGAIKGMVDALGDPYTAFLTPEEAKQLEDELAGVISGIGAEVGIKNEALTIIAPIENSPAKKAGLKAGDVIVSIDGEETANMDINTAVSKIRGKEGTKVKLLIKRDGTEKEYEITREKVTIKSVSSEIKENNVGYISLSRFDDNTTSELRTVLDDFKSKNVKKVILDLRDNPGGYLDESITVASQFVKEGVIVSEKKDVESGQKNEYKSVSGGKMTGDDIKLVVLVNKGSASASEIVAGAIQDHKRGQIVGETTFGKGSVQEIEDLSRGAKLRVTIAHWYTPNGRNITKEGIKPDFAIELTDEDYNNDKDPQLAKAIEILK